MLRLRLAALLAAAALACGLAAPAEAAQMGRQAALFGGQQTVWRGIGQGIDQTQGSSYNGGGSMSETFRVSMYANTPIRYCKVAVPLFYQNGASLTDTLFAGNQATLSFQFGFEYPLTQAFSGLSNRIPVTFGGANYWTYNNASWVSGGGGWFKLSDTFDIGGWIPRLNKYAIWSTVEIPTNIGPSALPTSGNNISNCLQRYMGTVVNNLTQIKGLGASADLALTSTSIPAALSSAAGQAGYAPMLVCEVPASLKEVVTIGDSIGEGVDEGTLGGGQSCASVGGDVDGDALGNAGLIMRSVFENTGANGVNLARASDGLKNIHTSSNWLGRQALLALANPTTVFMQNIHNDISSASTPGSWVKNTAYPKYTVKYNGANIYMVVVAGTTQNQTGAGPTGTGNNIVDGTVRWNWLQSYAGNSTDSTASLAAWEAQADAVVASLVPNAWIVGVTATPYSNSASVAISPLTSLGTTATATTASTANLTTGMYLTIAGASPAAYDGTYQITVVDGTHFSYVFAGGTSPAAGTITYNDEWSTIANQSVGNGNWGPGTIENLWNGYVRSLNPNLGINAYVDPDLVVEYNYPTSESGLWNVAPASNVQFDFTGDGIHLSSPGYYAVQQAGVIGPATIH